MKTSSRYYAFASIIRAAFGPPETFEALLPATQGEAAEGRIRVLAFFEGVKWPSVPHYGFEWNDEKAQANERKHGVTFAEAATCFADVFAVELYDSGHSVGEDRFILLGRSTQGRVLVIAFTLRTHETIRIISAREARRQEQKEYERQRRED